MKTSEVLTKILIGCMAQGSHAVQARGDRIYFKDANGLVVAHASPAEFCCALLVSINDAIVQCRQSEDSNGRDDAPEILTGED